MTGCITTVVIVFAVLIADDVWHANPWVKWPVFLDAVARSLRLRPRPSRPSGYRCS
jgi:hypothetical protein